PTMSVFSSIASIASIPRVALTTGHTSRGRDRTRSAMVDDTTSLEEDAVRRVLAGDANAYRPLVERHQRALFCVLRRYATDDDAAMDLVQRAFVKAYGQLSTLERAAAFKPWLF